MPDAIGAAIDSNDLDELLRLVDAFCATREWDRLVALRDRARRAFETGRQLWPASSYAEYRLALDAAPEFAALVVTEDAGRFAFGPIAEVAASTHTWAELAPHLARGPVAALCAHERVVRGERVDADAVADADVLSVPLAALAPWEPEYFVPTYRPDRVDEDGPEPLRGRPLELPGSRAAPVSDPDAEHALRDLVRPWTATSDGHARVAIVEGDVADAIGSLGVSGVRGAYVDAGEALVRMAWAASTGGRHGRRRGAAAGRDLTWAAAGACCGFESGERLETATLGDAITALSWFVWNAPDVATGWQLRLAVHDPVDGVAFVLDAADRGEGDEVG